MSVGSNDIDNLCRGYRGRSEEESEYIKAKNRLEVKRLVDFIEGEVKKIRKKGAEVIVVAPPCRVRSGKGECYALAGEMLKKVGDSEGFEVLEWDKLIKEELDTGKQAINQIYWKDGLHMDNGGTNLIWQEIKSRLQRRGLAMDRVKSNRLAIPYGTCLKCGDTKHLKPDCPVSNYVKCVRCGKIGDHTENLCVFKTDICLECGRYGHASLVCPGWRRK